MNKKLISIFLGFLIFAQTSFAFNESNSSSLKDWFINPFGKDNPVFYGGPELFASSRVGQVYLPAMGVSLLSPIYSLSTGLMGAGFMRSLGGLSTDYIAHVAWRLGCDQGYLAAKELKFDEYPDVQGFLFGQSDLTSKHPTLASLHNQTLTPTALLLFGVGQVLGQRYFGPFMSKQFSKFKLFNTKMGSTASQSFMDMYGWPVVGTRFLRSDALGKISGILMGTYLGWSLNDFGWQLANWRKVSLDGFSEYMPYYGNEDFGSIDKGWGILGFTVGGFLGHNIGASFATHSLSRFGMAASKTKTFLTHGTAIGTNLLLGLTLTTYFPHIYKTLFTKNKKPISISGVKALSDMNSQEQDHYIDEYLTASLEGTFKSVFNAHRSSYKQSYKKLSRSLHDKTLTSENISINGNNKYSLDQNEILNNMSSNSSDFKKIILFMSQNIQKLVTKAKNDLRTIKTLKNLKLYINNELDLLLPESFFLNKKTPLNQITTSLNIKKNMDLYKIRFIEYLVYIYPYVYKSDLISKMKKLSNIGGERPDGVSEFLLHKRNIVTMQLMEYIKVDYKYAQVLKAKFLALHKSLIGHDYKFYNNNPDILKTYLRGLDLLSKEMTSSLQK